MRLIFIRHGEPNYEKDCLTAIGKEQAELAAQRLAEEKIEEIWTSPLGRAVETAEATYRALGLPVKTLDFMREITWGSTDQTELFAGGHPWDITNEMARQGLNLNDPNWRETPFFKTNRVLECVDQIETGIDEWLAHFGYIRDGLYYRNEKEEPVHRTIALFCHGGSSAAAIGHILNLPFPYVCALLHLEFTGITILRFDRKVGERNLPCLELANDGRHILKGKYHRLKDM